MKKSFLLLIASVTITLFIVSACSGGGSKTNAQTATTTTQATSATSIDDSKMESMIMEKLLGHHSIDIVLQAKHTREEWNVTLDRMIARGAPISEDEKKLIIDWLLSRNP